MSVIEPGEAIRPSETEAAAVDRSVQEPLPANEPLPLWFEWLVVVVGAGVVSFGLAGLVLALAGWFHAGIAIALGSVGTAVGVLIARPSAQGRAMVSRSTHLAALAMCAVALGLALWNGAYDGHHVFLDIDSGVNTQSAKWIAEDGGVVVHAGTEWSSKGPEFQWTSIALYDAGSGNLEFQFEHFLPALMAEGSVGGDAGMFFVVPLLGSLGLIAIFAVAARISRRPWLAFGVVAALGLSLPQVWISRDPYSETGTQVLVWCGIYLLAEAFRLRRVGTAALGGLIIGATFATRIDALTYLIPLPTIAAFAWIGAHNRVDRTLRLKQFAAIVVCAVPPALLGAFDLRWRSTDYYLVLKSQLHSLIVGLTASTIFALVVLVVTAFLPVPWDFWTKLRVKVAAVVGSITALGFAVGWTIRPNFIQRTTPEHVNPAIPGVQKAEGYPVDPLRTYGEQSLRWMSWYLGPILLALAILGLAILTYQVVRRAQPLPVLVLSVAGACSLLYLWNPNITPLQIYAMRRYVPATLPLLVVAAAFALSWIVDLVPAIQLNRRTRAWVQVAAVFALIAFPVRALQPVRDLRVQAGYNELIDKTCSAVGPRAAILLPNNGTQTNGDQNLANLIMQTLRGWCNAPVASVKGSITAERLSTVARKFKAEGRTLWVVAASPGGVATVDAGLTPVLIGKVTNTHQLPFTLNHPPTSYSSQAQSIYVAKVNG